MNKELKDYTDLLVRNAQVLLKRDRVLHPILVPFTDMSTPPKPRPIQIATDEDVGLIADLMKSLAKKSIALVLLMDGFSKTNEIRDGAPVENDDEISEAIVALVYTKNETSMRHIFYVEKDGEYSFCDMGWDTANKLEGNFANPYKPDGLKYLTNPASYSTGTAVAANSPTSNGGKVASYSVAPALPAGLILSPITGVITGTPTIVTATADYVVTATNAVGSTTASLSITVTA
jgi:Putative Ig domain